MSTMRKKWRLAIVYVLFVLWGTYLFWSSSGRSLPPVRPSLQLMEIQAWGTDCQRGNLIAIQPFMVPEDYASQEHLYQKLDGYLQEAAARQWLQPQTIVVFPEYIGTWLVVAGEKKAVYRASTIAQAMETLVLSNFFAFSWTYFFCQAEDRAKEALFRLKAQSMAASYERVFSRLAKHYAVTVVAGSIVLPNPQISNGRLQPGQGPLYNVSVVYQPSGLAHNSLVRKAFPIAEELSFTASASPAHYPVFETPAGKLGVLICADSWHPGPYKILKEQGAALLAVPSYATPDDCWEKPWKGYSGTLTPADVSGELLTQRAAWLKWAMAGRLGNAGIAHGVNVFLRGQLWDLGDDGHNILVRERAIIEGSAGSGAAIHNLWLP